MISIKDYAVQKKVSYEAVRKQLKRYKKILQNHITVQNRTRYLDDYAVNFLDQKRASSPVIIVQQTKDDEIELLKAENTELNRKLTAQAEAMVALAQWNSENAVLIAEANQNKILLEQKDKSIHNLNEQISNQRVEIQNLETAKAVAEQHAENLQAFLEGAEERAVQLEGKVGELTEQLQNERSDAEKEHLELQNKIEQLELQHQAELLAEADKWKNKGLLDRLFKR